jgi:hypothetical protein
MYKNIKHRERRGKPEGPRLELGLEKKGVQGRKPHEEGHRGPKHSIREKK